MAGNEEKEIARILCGYTTHRGDFTVASEKKGKGLKSLANKGGFNGSFSVTTLGLYKMCHEYKIQGKLLPQHQWAAKQIYSLGSPAHLYENPDTVCSLRMRMLGNPAFLKLEAKDRLMRLSVYTAKTPLSQVVCTTVFTAFEQQLPEDIKLLNPGETEKRVKEEKAKEQQAEKEEKKSRKSRKKRDTGSAT